MRGVLVTVEGVEGSGKSTQCGRLAAYLAGRGLEVVQTSEPDGTPLGLRVRSLFEDGPTPTPLTQAFLFMAARQEHVSRVIAPALARGAVVISDRYADATVAYQGYGQGMDVQTVRELNLLATGGILPDLTLVLDLDPAAGMARIHGRALDAFEKMDLAFHRRVREGYLEIARADKSRVQVLSADRTSDQLHADVVRAVDDLLARRGGSRGA
ncbi:MAG TPA: dTMP kinase [Candidatus Dormibacteraeota bacterium]|jgi:dTMP kinase|nr:dTMP kinase [Candidatus Dormibacteraeota bacterium]